MEWGSVADWLAVLIAFLGLIVAVVVGRDKLTTWVQPKIFKPDTLRERQQLRHISQSSRQGSYTLSVWDSCVSFIIMPVFMAIYTSILLAFGYGLIVGVVLVAWHTGAELLGNGGSFEAAVLAANDIAMPIVLRVALWSAGIGFIFGGVAGFVQMVDEEKKRRKRSSHTDR